MTEKDVLELIEDRNLELKKARNTIPESFWETYSAFANTDGGLVVLGVDEKKEKVVGVENPHKLKEDLLNQLNNPQKVSANILDENDIKIILLDNNLTIMTIKVPEAPYRLKPIYLKNNPKLAYERLGEGDRKLSPEKYKELIVNSKEETDQELLKNYDLSDLNEEDLRRYREELYRQTGNEKYQTIKYKDMLIEIGALRRNRQEGGDYCLSGHRKII
ncbi:MAG: putative DNA binding domain-containing protein [Bacillota bacterium]|nr:putative DNA binding domain-containing protein [Bacillota bacterium]